MAFYRTPLRYPGGKQRLAPFIYEVIEKNGIAGGHYCEPYAGGAGVAIELLLDNRISHIHLNDSSWPIFTFWNSVVTQPDKLCRRIWDAAVDVEEWKKQREVVRHPKEHPEIEVGFATFYLNRCNRSGVLSGGLIGGLEQAGKWKMGARFNKEALIKRIENIAKRADSITLRNWDAERFVLEYVPHLPVNTLVYCDPPYYAKTGRLYLNQYQDSDHARVAQVIQARLQRRWVVSYNDAPQILEYYRDRRSFCYDLQYSARRVYKGREVFVFSDDLVIPTKSSLSYISTALNELVQVSMPS